MAMSILVLLSGWEGPSGNTFGCGVVWPNELNFCANKIARDSMSAGSTGQLTALLLVTKPEARANALQFFFSHSCNDVLKIFHRISKDAQG